MTILPLGTVASRDDQMQTQPNDEPTAIQREDDEHASNLDAPPPYVEGDRPPAYYETSTAPQLPPPVDITFNGEATFFIRLTVKYPAVVRLPLDRHTQDSPMHETVDHIWISYEASIEQLLAVTRNELEKRRISTQLPADIKLVGRLKVVEKEIGKRIFWVTHRRRTFERNLLQTAGSNVEVTPANWTVARGRLANADVRGLELVVWPVQNGHDE